MVREEVVDGNDIVGRLPGVSISAAWRRILAATMAHLRMSDWIAMSENGGEWGGGGGGGGDLEMKQRRMLWPVETSKKYTLTFLEVSLRGILTAIIA